MKTCLTILAGALLGLTAISGSANAATTIRVLGIVPSDTREKDFNAQAGKDFAAAHPGVSVEFDYLENEAFKTKLTTMLQSSQRPDIFQSWGGGLFQDQVKAGVLQDITGAVKADFDTLFPKSSLEAYMSGGKIYGAPRNAAMVVVWYNKELAAKAGVDVPSIKTWDDFLAAVKKAKDAGVTPIVVGAKDKWPVHFYYGYLALRTVGKDGLAAARAGKDGGFDNPAFVKVGEEFKKLIDLKPFQEGFGDATFDKAAGQFGDGKALFHLMGSFGYSVHQRNAADGKGLSDDKVGIIPFPAVPGGKGDPSDVFGGSDGWAVSAGAPKEAAQFLDFLLQKKYQEASAEAGIWIPAIKGAGDKLNNPFFKQISGFIASAKNFQNYLDVDFGLSIGTAVNEAATDMVLGAASPKDAASHIEETRALMQ